MDGVAGKAGWAWIFILEGLVTFIVGGFGYVFGANNVKLMAIIKP